MKYLFEVQEPSGDVLLYEWDSVTGLLSNETFECRVGVFEYKADVINLFSYYLRYKVLEEVSG